MKTKNHIKVFLALSVMTFSANAQRWDLGGNTDATPPPNGLLSNSNYFGGTQTASLRFGTGNTTRMFMDNLGAGTGSGRIGFGNNLLGFTPADRLHLNHTSFSSVRMRFTFTGMNQDASASIGSTNQDGSTIGINNLGEFMFTQFETKPMIFETNGTTERFRITEDDRIIAFRRASLFFPNIPPVNYPTYISKFEIDDRTNDNLMLFRV